MLKQLRILLAVIALSGCNKDRNLTIPPEDLLTAAARAELKLPSNNELTLSTKEDFDFVANLTPETVEAVERSLKPTGRKSIICAARPVGNYLLLWIAFPEVADGGMDLIWSLERQKPVGTFVGGYRG